MNGVYCWHTVVHHLLDNLHEWLDIWCLFYGIVSIILSVYIIDLSYTAAIYIQMQNTTECILQRLGNDIVGNIFIFL